MDSLNDDEFEQYNDEAAEVMQRPAGKRGPGLAVRVIIVIAVVVVVILVVVRVRSISMGPLKTEAAETRLTLEAMEGQDIESIRQEISLKRSVAESSLETSSLEEGESVDSGESAEITGEVEETYDYYEEPSAEGTEIYDYYEEPSAEGTETYDYYEEPAVEVYE